MYAKFSQRPPLHRCRRKLVSSTDVIIAAIQVRLAWLRCVGDWMLNLRERVDHESRLMPYALSALDDPHPQVRAALCAFLDYWHGWGGLAG